VCRIVCLLLIIGALNWGLIGLFEYNLVTAILGGFPIAEKVVYILIGAAGVMALIRCFAGCKLCKKSE